MVDLGTPRLRAAALKRTAAVFVLSLLVGGHAIAQIGPPSVVGPGRTLITPTPWGAFYFEPRALTHVSVAIDISAWKVVSSQGTARISLRSPSDFVLEYDKGQGRVQQQLATLTVELMGKTWTFQNDLARFIVTTPDDQITYERRSDGMNISGKKGPVTIRTRMNETVVTSRAGTTSIRQDPRSGYARTGPDLSKHPYLGRGWFLSHKGVGIFVDMWKLNPIGGVFAELEWDPL